MQQTILALLAILTVTLFTLNQNQNVAQTYNNLVDDELEVAASSVALHVLELISDRSFDSRTRPVQIESKGMIVGSSDLTASSAFGSYTNCDLDEPFKDTVSCLDIDDADMRADEWQAVPFRMRGGQELPFDVQVQVSYVDPTDMDTPLSSSQTSFYKKVVVKVRSKHHVEQNRYLNGFVSLERIFSYDSQRSENRYEEKYNKKIADLSINLTVDPAVVEDPGVEYTTVCHRSVELSKIVWATKSVEQKYVAQHIGHGDTLGTC